MKKSLIAAIALSLSFVAPAANADVPPQADVSCQLSSNGVTYSTSMTFSGGSISFSSLTFQWDYMVAPAGVNVQQLSNYGPRTAYTTTSGNSLELTYDQMLAMANGNTGATVLVYANSVFASGGSTIKNTMGKGCYVDLPTVYNNKQQMVTQQAEAAAAAASKAAADALAASQKKATDAAQVETIYQQVLKINTDIDNTASAAIAKMPNLKGNLAKFMNSRPGIPLGITPDLTVDSIQKTLTQLTQFQVNLIQFITYQAKVLPKTITCVKGKTVKKVTAVNAKCPVGYKIK